MELVPKIQETMIATRKSTHNSFQKERAFCRLINFYKNDIFAIIFHLNLWIQIANALLGPHL